MLAAAWLLVAAGAAIAGPAPVARAGLLDLSAWDFERDGIVSLDGEWEFFPGQLLPPQQPAQAAAFQQVPQPWNSALGGGHGVATYRLRVACPPAGLPATLSIALPFEHSAAALYANGRLVARQGTVGGTREQSAPELGNRTALLGERNCPLELVAQVSNFHVFRGGMVRSVQLGTAARLAERREGALVRSLLSIGSVAVVGFLALMFYAWRRQDRIPLYFAVYCLSFASSLGLSGERPLQPLVAGLGFENQFRLLFVNWFLGLGLFPLFLRELYGDEIGRWPLRAIVTFSAAGALLPLVSPIQVFSVTAPLLQWGGLAVGLYVSYVLARAWRRGRGGAAILLAGMAVLAAAVAHDVVFFQHILSISLLPLGVVGIVVAPAILLARRFARALAAEEARAVEQQGRTDMLVRATKAGLLDWDTLRDVVTYSERYKEMLGLPAQTPDAQMPAFADLLHPDERDRVLDQFRAQLRDRGVRHGLRQHQPQEYQLRHQDGHYLWVHAEGIGVCGADGRTLRFICSFIDISERHATAQALATERERLGLLVRSTRAGFGDWDAQRNEVRYTERFKEMLGYPPDYDTAQWPSIFEMMHPEDGERARAEFREMIRRKPRGGEQVPGKAMSYRLRRRDGSYVWILAEGIALVDEEGRTRRFITAYQDVTRFHEQEEALRASHDQIAAQAAQLEARNEALKENVRLREEVERIGRHDIKTPLNSIVAVPRLLREERQLGPEADELLGIVERAGYRILSMVNLSLDLYKMEEGSYVFRPDAVDLADLMSKVAADVRIHAESKQVRLKVDVADAPYAWAEELLCYSLLANLLKNAVEASPEGSVVTVSARAAQDGRLALKIHNRGVVPESIRGTFFQKYATLGKASGTGLGTYSARLMARVQDGDIEMETAEATGTTLAIRLRAAPAGAVPATMRHVAERRGIEPLRVAAMPPMRVLLVDDDEYNLLIVRRFLPTPPFTVDTAINGRVALAAAELQWPDVIFMDLDMPVMGGLQAVQELRALERATLARRCTMVALSSHDDEETRLRSLAAGFDSYLVKPVTRDAIHETLLELTTLIGAGDGDLPAQVPTAEVAALAAQAVANASAPGVNDPVVLDADIGPILGDFMASRRKLIAGMEAAMEGGDRGEVRRLAHQLAGSFGLYGFHWASDQSRLIEREFSQIEPQRLAALAAQMRAHLDTVEIRFSPA